MNSSKITAHLRVLATSDVHMHLTGFDMLRDKVTPGRGMDTLAQTIKTARAAATGQCLLFDNGDALQGTPVGDVCVNHPLPAHPWAEITAALGYDAVGLGNHDFDFGLPFLEQFVAQMQTPVLCASLNQGQIAGVQPDVILHLQITCSDGETRALAVGVTSVLPPQTSIWNHRHVEGQIAFADGITATRRATAALRENGADLIVLLCHSGLPEGAKPPSENFAADVAQQAPGIDVMIMGHTHIAFPNGADVDVPGCDSKLGVVHSVPAVMPGYAASTLGIIDLSLRWTTQGWHVDAHRVALAENTNDLNPEPRITAIAAPALAATRAALNVEVAPTHVGFNIYFQMLQSGLATNLLADAMMQTIARHVAGTELATLPLVAVVAPTAVGGRGGTDNYVTVAQGMIKQRHLTMMCPYPNTIWAAVLTGADLRNWSERAASYFSPTRGELSPLTNPASPVFNFDALYGMHTCLDPFQTARYDSSGQLKNAQACRVTSLKYQGDQVDDAARFLVAMTSYRGAGGGNFPGLSPQTKMLRTDIELKKSMLDALASGAIQVRRTPSVWQFAPDLDATVIVETSPMAAQHLEEIAAFDPHPIGISENGFLRLKVSI